jgi:hypothetical protein
MYANDQYEYKALEVSSKITRFVNILKRTTTLSRESLDYIKSYQIAIKPMPDSS